MIVQRAKVIDLQSATLQRVPETVAGLPMPQNAATALPAERRPATVAGRSDSQSPSADAPAPARAPAVQPAAHAGGFPCVLASSTASARDSATTCARARLVDRLAQQAPRQKPVVAERLQGVEQDDIQIAGDPAMLKGVVQDQAPAADWPRAPAWPPPRGRDSARAARRATGRPVPGPRRWAGPLVAP